MLYYCLVAFEFVQVVAVPTLRFVPGKFAYLTCISHLVALPIHEEGANFEPIKYIL
jgi:hypothetical protein